MTKTEKAELATITEMLSQMQDEITAIRAILQTNAAVVSNGGFDKRTFENDGTYQIAVVSPNPIESVVTVYRNKVTQATAPSLQWAVRRSKPWPEVKEWLQSKGKYFEERI